MVLSPIVTGVKAFAFLMGKEIKAIRDDAYNLRQLAGRINADVQELKEAIPSIRMQDYINSRGGGLVSNGLGTLGNNYNFSRFEYVKYNFPSELPVSGSGFFKIAANTKTRVETDEFIPIDKTSEYDYYVYTRLLSGTVTGSALAVELTAYNHKKEPLNSEAVRLVIFEGNQVNTWTKRGREVSGAELPNGVVYVRPTFTFNTRNTPGLVFGISAVKLKEKN